MMKAWIFLFQSIGCFFFISSRNHVLVSSFSTTTIPTTTTTGSTSNSHIQQLRQDTTAFSTSLFMSTPNGAGTSAEPINILEKLSVSAVSGIQESHRLGHQIGTSILRPEVMFAGLISHPENAQFTITKFEMTTDKIVSSVTTQLQNQPNLELNPTTSDEALPFSSATKLVLAQAADISISLGSDEIRSEHILLALMGYNLGDRIEASPVLSVLTNVQPPLKGANGKPFSVFNFCEALVQDLKNAPPSDGSVAPPPRRVEKNEIVVGGGGLGGIGMATLSSVGVDMTQMALDGELDPVYGRDQEIRSALRTLGRRRKNNPCLIGGTLLDVFLFLSLHQVTDSSISLSIIISTTICTCLIIHRTGCWQNCRC